VAADHLAHQASPSSSEGIRIYAIGDVHGRADLLDLVFARIDADLAGRRGAGPFSAARRLCRPRSVLPRRAGPLVARSSSHELVCLKGNHEGYMAEFLRNPSVLGLGGMSAASRP